MKRVIAAVSVVLAVLLLSACGHKTVDNSEVALRYENGATQGNKFVGCLKPGSSINTNDKIYRYPNNQREWRMQSGARGADEPSLHFTSKDGIQMTAELRVSFKLNTSCKDVKIGGKTYKGGVIEAFHELVGRTRHAYFRSDGTYDAGDRDSGWPYVIETYIGTQVHTLFRDYGPQYEAQPLWLNQQVAIADSTGQKDSAQRALADQVEASLADQVNKAMEGDAKYFEQFNVQIVSIEPASQFRKQYTDRKNAQVKAQTAELNRQAQVIAAKAAADVLKAKVAGYGGFDNYLRYLLIKQGGNPFQPQYLVGGSK